MFDDKCIMFVTQEYCLTGSTCVLPNLQQRVLLAVLSYMAPWALVLRERGQACQEGDRGALLENFTPFELFIKF